MDASSIHEVTVNPRFGRRSWVKLWVNEWLDGTTRFEMSDAQRAFWIDLLALAGRSRYPGIICAGKSNDGSYIGYPLNKFQALMAEPINVEETLALFVKTGKIALETTAETPVRLMKIELLSWDKYQSEYQRQKGYRSRAKLQQSDTQSDTQSYNQSNNTDTDTETEGEVDTETPSAVDAAFGEFWKLYPRPVGKKKAKELWKKLSLQEQEQATKGLRLWQQAEQWKRDDGKYIPYASTFLQQRRWEDEPWFGAFSE